jgi:tRNA-Thr(GGU) m(6)t(6)A37 methyltransferase TsaA
MFHRIRSLFQRDQPQPPDLPDIVLRPIGYVRSRVKEPMPDGWEGVVSRIILRPEYEPMLLGLDGYSHIIVLSWPHLVPAEVRGSRPQFRPRDDPAYPLMGVLAMRSQTRPNPVLVSTVRLLELKGTTLKVKGLDAVDGTPVIDIKPYLPFHDAVTDARVPNWVAQK